MDTFQDEEREGGLLAPPRPTEYRRMLSWQLSGCQEMEGRRRRRRRRGVSPTSGEEERREE